MALIQPPRHTFTIPFAYLLPGLGVITVNDCKSNKLSINKDIEKISGVSGKDVSAIVSQPLVVKNILKNSDKTSADSLITENLYNILMKFNKYNRFLLRKETYIFDSDINS
jgi:hypothetical protein